MNGPDLYPQLWPVKIRTAIPDYHSKHQVHGIGGHQGHGMGEWGMQG